ncbi:Uncharacterised protein [Candidatus Ornithobacterium hominis]|uniref:Uncharacterized protein n=1 Tax=Candidatus Ornithobacterium hominis TaxID=2497989 RepID=A0A383U3H7_9FLAO|nr:hypothetical protein [Candidatus Ornithobacterium hominis]MCT7904713.1 hypothetical protein [Candidatus Ornithobacterium hominis]SZD73939.1 Uncharacterised protein [Candidatus Ornithobacterium hominis]
MTKQQQAKEYFSRHPERERVFGTSDGFLFEEKQNAAKHAETLEYKEVVVFKNEAENRPEAEEDKSILQLSVANLTSEIKKIDDAKLIEALLIQEKESAKRKGAIEVLEDRIKELNEIK